MDSKQSPRYPYTYACDYLRVKVDDYSEEVGMRVTTISRSQASQAIGAVAEAIGMPKEDLARKLADAFLSASPGG
ncbi:MAG: hypothetical protein EOP14_00045 [Pseudomonas sp.]|nr:MAG: hypothetical protein EOP14_00045 [Pseudomonas sp.]